MDKRGIIEVGLAAVLLWLALGVVVFSGVQTTDNDANTYPGQYQERYSDN